MGCYEHAHQRDRPLRADESPLPETQRTAGSSVNTEPGAKEMGCAVEMSPIIAVC